MFDLMLKLAKKKFLKPDEEVPSREYMRLDLELEEICHLHAMDMQELKSMSSSMLHFSFGAEEALQITGHLKRMRELWNLLPGEDRAYLSSPDKEVTEFDELAKDFQEKEYLQLASELESEAAVFYLRYGELVNMDISEMNKLLGKTRALEFRKKYQKAETLWDGLTMEQRDRNSLKRLNRTY